jgi:hypothetical protein
MHTIICKLTIVLNMYMFNRRGSSGNGIISSSEIADGLWVRL